MIQGRGQDGGGGSGQQACLVGGWTGGRDGWGEDLPECLFNTGYSNFLSYATKLSKHYNDSLFWTITSKTNVNEVYEGDLLDLSVEKTIAFLEGMKLIPNEGSSIQSVIKFIGVEFS